MTRINLVQQIASDRDSVKEIIRAQNLNNKEIYSALATITAGLSFSADNTAATDYKFPRVIKSSYTGGTATSSALNGASVLPASIVEEIYAWCTAALTDNGTAAGSIALYLNATAVWDVALGDGFTTTGLKTHSVTATTPLIIHTATDLTLKTSGITTGVTGSVTFFTTYIPLT